MPFETKRTLLFASIAAAVIAAGAYIQAAVWNECRAEGHSRLYCFRLISR